MSNIYIYVPTTTIWGLSLITSHFLLMHVIPTLVFGYSFPRGSSVFFGPYAVGRPDEQCAVVLLVSLAIVGRMSGSLFGQAVPFVISLLLSAGLSRV
jgi:hypothetical protein